MKILIADDAMAKLPAFRKLLAEKAGGKVARGKKTAVKPRSTNGHLVVSCAPRKAAGGKGGKIDCSCSGLELDDQPELSAAILDALGIALLNNGCGDEGAKLIELALKIRRKAFGPDHPLTAASLNSYARVLRERGDYARAETEINDALRINRAVFGEGLPVVASLVQLGVIQLYQSRFHEAEATAIAGLTILEKLSLTQTDRNTTRLMDIRGRAEDNLGKSAAADVTYTQLLALDRKQLGTVKDQKYATHLANHAGVKESLQKFNEAERYYRQSIDVYLNVLNRPCHPNLIDFYANLGSVLRRRIGNAAALKEAGELFRKALHLNIHVRGAAHELVGHDYGNLGRWQYDTGATKDAIGSFSKALTIYGRNVQRGRFAADHVYIAETLTWKGRILVESERPSAALQAEPLLEEALALWPVHLGARTVGEGIASSALGYALVLQNKNLDRAAQLLREGYAIVLPALGEKHPLTQRIAKWIATLPDNFSAYKNQAC